jgi:hypothetical protein
VLWVCRRYAGGHVSSGIVDKLTHRMSTEVIPRLDSSVQIDSKVLLVVKSELRTMQQGVLRLIDEEPCTTKAGDNMFRQNHDRE